MDRLSPEDAVAASGFPGIAEPGRGGAGCHLTQKRRLPAAMLAVRVPLVRMPVAPGRSIATLVEVAARNELLKTRGYHPARELTDRLAERQRTAAANTEPEG